MIVYPPPALFIYYKKLKIRRERNNEELASIIRYISRPSKSQKYQILQIIKFTEVILNWKK